MIGGDNEPVRQKATRNTFKYLDRQFNKEWALRQEILLHNGNLSKFEKKIRTDLDAQVFRYASSSTANIDSLTTDNMKM